MCGITYSVYKVKPVYTASRSVIFRTAFREEDATTAAGSVSLAKMYLPDVEKAIKAPNIIRDANKEYGDKEDPITAGAVSVNYGSDSLIFKVSYSGDDAKIAEAKLSVLIDTAADRIKTLIQADDVTLINVQQDADISVSSDFNKYVILGVAIGIMISVGIVVIKYLMDNTVKSKSEYEYLTGVSVLAVIDKVDEKDN